MSPPRLLRPIDLPLIYVPQSKIVGPANSKKPASAKKGGWRLIIERTVESEGVVMLTQNFNQSLSLLQGIENLISQQFISYFSIMRSGLLNNPGR